LRVILSRDERGGTVAFVTVLVFLLYVHFYLSLLFFLLWFLLNIGSD
jgi:hypothetical protein